MRHDRSRRRSVEQLIAEFEEDRAVTEDAKETRTVPDMAGAVALLAARGLLPAIWFIFSRKDCELAAAKIGRSAVTLCSPVRHWALGRIGSALEYWIGTGLRLLSRQTCANAV